MRVTKQKLIFSLLALVVVLFVIIWLVEKTHRNKMARAEQLFNEGEILLQQGTLESLQSCNTATPGGERANGVEIEGFGAVAQKQGTKAVMATLWSVADDSTREWMVKFYDLYDKQNLTKAEAVRQSQLAMIYGKYKPSDGNTSRGIEIVNSKSANKEIEFKKDDDAPLAHPFYWSPFILIGNWR